MSGRTTIHRLADADADALRDLAAACGLYNPHQRGVGNLSALMERLAAVAATDAGRRALTELLIDDPTRLGLPTEAARRTPPAEEGTER